MLQQLQAANQHQSESPEGEERAADDLAPHIPYGGLTRATSGISFGCCRNLSPLPRPTNRHVCATQATGPHPVSPVSADQAATLATAAKAGNDLAFRGLLELVLEPGYRLACGMLHDPHAAEDAVQEAALKAWRKVGQLREGQALRAWFLSIVANECRDVQRSRWWSVLKGAEAREIEESSPDSVVRGMELRRALRGLDREKRLVVVLHWYLDLPLEEIAVITGASVHAVESRLYRGVRELRGRLEETNAD